METNTDKHRSAADADPDQFPSYGSLSPALAYRRVLVYTGPAHKIEFFEVQPPAEDDWALQAGVTEWNWFWEAGPYRPAHLHDQLAPHLPWLDRLPLDVEAVLVPATAKCVYEKWSPLFHLIPAATLERFGLPLWRRGKWPRFARSWRTLSPRMEPALSHAFADYIWPLIGRGGMTTFGAREPLRLLAHDLGFWLPHMELLLRDANKECGRVPREKEDADDTYAGELPADLRIDRPTYGVDLWSGEDEAWEVAQMLVERADSGGKLRALIDAVRSNRVEEDFSSRWSYEREDFERRLYHKRARIKVSFVEIDDDIPFHGSGADLDGNLIWRDLVAVVEPRDRRVVVCLRRGTTRVGEIAKELGYANHSPVSKALERIRRAARAYLL
jgi:hypothetical protein